MLALAAILSYLAFLDLRIFAILALASAAFVGYTYKMMPARMAKQEALRKTDREMAVTGWDSLRNILVVKSTTNEQFARNLLSRGLEKIITAYDDFGRFNKRMQNSQNIIYGVGALGALLLAVENFTSGKFTFGNLTAVTAFVFALLGYIKYIQWQFKASLEALTDYKILSRDIDILSEDYSSGKTLALKGAVEFKNVRFRYREDKPTLEDVSFQVPAGSRVAIVGESGEGKTTLVDLLGRYWEPQSGSIFLDGFDLRKINLKSLREQMAYVPQDLTLFHETIGANIHYGRPEASDDEVAHAAALAHLDEFIEGLPEKYETLVGERGLKLSGGERQRVALARAFLRNPKLLVLDEPTAHLDSKTEIFIQESLQKLMAGRPTFIIAHRLRTVAEADMILVLKDGSIIETGRHEELAARQSSIYAQLLKAQSGYLSPQEIHLGEAETR